jgi:hypothetical protein
LEKIIIPNNIKKIGRLSFFGCEKLREVHFSNSLRIIENRAFAYCDALESIIIPESVIGIEERAFCNCLKLRKVVFKNENTLYDVSAFVDCASLALAKPYRVGKFKKLKKLSCFDADICPITREKMTNKSIAILLKCGHIFLEVAFAEWEKLQSFCPCCRVSFL